MDSEYVLKYYLILEKTLEKVGTRMIGDFAYVTDGIHESIDFDESTNINLISAKAPKNNFFDLSGTGYISTAQNSANPRTQLIENDIIISTVGTIGNCAVVNERILPANADRHVGIIRISNSAIKPRFLSTFFLTKFGRYQTIRFTTGNVQPNLFIYKVKDIKVPLLSIEFQNAIEQTILYSDNLRSESEKIILSTEELLNDYLGVHEFEESSCAVKTLSQSFVQSGRLDAEYYQPKYDVLFDSLLKFTTANLGELVDIKKSIEPGSEAYQDEGIPFVRVSDVNKFGISEPSIKLSPSVVPDIASLYPKKDTIILSKDGSVGIAYKVRENMQAITSGALLHLTIKDTSTILPDYLTLALNSQIVQLQAERDCNGAIIQHWKPSDIEKVVIPLLDMDKQKEISVKVQESFRLRKEAKQLLDKAIKAVELAIETDEEAALSKLTG